MPNRVAQGLHRPPHNKSSIGPTDSEAVVGALLDELSALLGGALLGRTM